MRRQPTLLRMWGGFCGLLFQGNPRLFTYIADSLLAQPDRVEMRRRFAAHGLKVIRSRRHYAGLLETTFVQK